MLSFSWWPDAFRALLEYKRELQLNPKRYNGIDDYLDQGDMFGRERSPEVELLTRFLGNAKSIKTVRDALNAYADAVEKIDVHTSDMFGAKDEGKDSVLRRVLGVENKTAGTPANTRTNTDNTRTNTDNRGKQAETRDQKDSDRPAVHSSSNEGRFNQDSDTPLLSAEEDSGDFQLFSETPKEAAKREQAAEKAEADKLERAKAEARRNAPELPFSRGEKSDPYARIRETKEGSAERVKAFMELPDGEHELGGKKFSKQGMVFQRDGQQLSDRGIEKSFRGVDVGNANLNGGNGGNKTTAASQKIEDFGEKIGGARKDLAEKTGPRTTAQKKDDSGEPKWKKNYIVDQLNSGKWAVFHRKHGMMLLAARNMFDTRE